ncbi:folate carrier protein, partial [Striga asiatica]
YNKAKQRYLQNKEGLSPVLHLASAAEAGGLPLHQSYLAGENTVAASDTTTSSSIFWFSWLALIFYQLFLFCASKLKCNFHYRLVSDALRTILKEEGWMALYKGLVPGLFMVSHGAIQFTAYEELRKMVINIRTEENVQNSNVAENLLDSFDYAVLGASSKLVAVLLTYPFQQRPEIPGIPRYVDSLHVLKETARFEGIRGFYKGITANVLKNAPAASLTFIVYENVLNMLKLAGKKDL